MRAANQSIIKPKIGLLNLAEDLRNVSKASRMMGVSRDRFYRMKRAKETGGQEALLHNNGRRANLKNQVEEFVDQAIVVFALDNPAADQVRMSKELRKQGVVGSPTGGRPLWLRHGLQNAWVAALEKKETEK